MARIAVGLLVIVQVLGGGGLVRAEREQVSESESAIALPPFEGVSAWFNTSEPPTPEQLRGKVVLVVFWAYSNANAVRVLPIIEQWYARYHPQGLEVIGVHSPEFPFERSPVQVQAAVRRFQLSFPIAVDSERQLWMTYQNHEWPAYYVANARGQLLGFQVGAGREAEVEAYLRTLLTAQHPVASLEAPLVAQQTVSGPEFRTPELIFRYPLGVRLASPQPPVIDEPRLYSAPAVIPLHAVALEGIWQFEDEERVRVMAPTGRLVVRFRASRCQLILEGFPRGQVLLTLDGRPIPEQWAGADVVREGERSILRFDHPRLYSVVDLKGSSAEHTLEAVLPRGTAVYSCTFS